MPGDPQIHRHTQIKIPEFIHFRQAILIWLNGFSALPHITHHSSESAAVVDFYTHHPVSGRRIFLFSCIELFWSRFFSQGHSQPGNALNSFSIACLSCVILACERTRFMHGFEVHRSAPVPRKGSISSFSPDYLLDDSSFLCTTAWPGSHYGFLVVSS